jgi:hypothetical protein
MEWSGRAPASKPGFYFPTAAPTVVRDLVVVGGLVRDNAETGSGQAGRYFIEAFYAPSRDSEAQLRRPDRPPGLFRGLRSISFVTPKARARDALAAVEKCLFNVDDHREIGYSAMACHRAPDILIPDNDGPTGNAKRFALTRNKEDQADAGVLQHVVKGIDAAVAAAIRNRKGCFVKTGYKSRAISF